MGFLAAARPEGTKARFIRARNPHFGISPGRSLGCLATLICDGLCVAARLSLSDGVAWQEFPPVLGSVWYGTELTRDRVLF